MPVSIPAPDQADTILPRIGVVSGSDAITAVNKDYAAITNDHGINDGLFLLKMILPHAALGRLSLTPNYFRQGYRWDFGKFDLLWNVISDADVNGRTLAVADKLIAAAGRPVVNRPDRIARTRRDVLETTLAGIAGVRAPRVKLLAKPTPERVLRVVRDIAFPFPAILRRTGTHNGEVVGVYDSPEALAAAPLDRKSSYYLIEFIDCRGPDGLYRKTRFFFVGDRIVTRQHIVADHWLIHGRSSRGIMAERPDLQDEGRGMLIDGFEALPAATRAALHAIRAATGLDYCGLDCCLMDDGGIVVFECNATMNFNPLFRNPKTQYNRAALPRMHDAMRALIATKTGIAVPAG